MTSAERRRQTLQLFKRYHRFVDRFHTYEHDINGDKSYLLIRDLLAALAKSDRRNRDLEALVAELEARLRCVEIQVSYLSCDPDGQGGWSP